MPEDSNTLANVVCTIAVNLQTSRVVTVRDSLNNIDLTCSIVELSLYICKTIDTADDLSCVLTKTVQDNAQWILTNLVSHLSNLDSTLSSSEALVTSEESEALCLFTEKTTTEVTMADTNLTVVSYRTLDTECLKTLTNSLCTLSSALAALLDSNSSTSYICPLCILKTNILCLSANLIRINTEIFTNLVSLFEVLDAILLENSVYLCLTTVLALITYFSNHVSVLLIILYVDQ